MGTALTNQELNALIEVGRSITSHLDLDSVLESVMTVTTEVLGVEASSLVLVDDETGDLLFHVTQGEKAEAIDPIRLKPGEGIVGWVIERGEPAIVNDVASDSRFLAWTDEKSGFETRQILCAPIATKNRLWGAVEVINTRDGSAFDEHDLSLCETIAGHAAVAIENATLHRRLVEVERLAAVGQTMAGLAHCVKNVLQGIKGGSYVLDLGLRDDNRDTLTKGWDIVKRNAVFMEDLVLDMLTYAKEREPEYEMCDINRLAQEVCETMTRKAEGAGVALDFDGCVDMGEIAFDPKGIRRCLMNLVSNAVDACEAGDGRVTVRTCVRDDVLCVEIGDNGCGIGETAKDKLFKEFYSTKGSKGTGLGLAVTHKIIAEHGGAIKVDSEEGQGTAFTINLPLRKAL